MKTYRCPNCADTHFSVQDVIQPDDQNHVTIMAVKVECQSCHWVGNAADLGGNH